MAQTSPILLMGAGRLGGALLEGWALTGAFAPSDVIIRDPQPSDAARAAAAAGARLNPSEAVLAEARTVLMAVKPQTAVTASIRASSRRSTTLATGSNRAWAASAARGSVAKIAAAPCATATAVMGMTRATGRPPKAAAMSAARTPAATDTITASAPR